MNSIRESLLNFLMNDTLRVAVLKGEWGIGKTFFWRNFFESEKNKLNFRAYSYVSLFGAKEISDLKRQVFSNFEMLDAQKLTKHLEKLKPISTFLKAIDIPYLNSSGPINDLIESKLIENFLICIDDLERKEESISGSSVLGFISQLKEEKSCKIILIYNDKELDEVTKKQINEYREKVVDLELTYRPTIDDNLSIIWPEGCPKCVVEIFHTLELNNIRVMQRVKWTIEYFAKEVCEKYPALRVSFESKCVMLTVIYHCHSDKISLNEFLSTSYYSLLCSKDENDKNRIEVLKKLKYMPEEQDAVIVEYLKGGYVNFSEFERLLRSKNKQYELNDINEQYLELWQKYYSNFVTSQDEFIDCQRKFLQEHIRDLSIYEVSSTIMFIRQLDPSVNLNDLLDHSIELFVEKHDRFDRSSIQFQRIEPEIIEKIEEKLAAKTPAYSITELIVMLAGRNGWNSEDITYLLKYSEDEFFNWITTESTAAVVNLLSEFLRRFSTQNENEKSVVEKVQKALEKVKQRSPIDRCRVEYLIERKSMK